MKTHRQLMDEIKLLKAKLWAARDDARICNEAADIAEAELKALQIEFDALVKLGLRELAQRNGRVVPLRIVQ